MKWIKFISSLVISYVLGFTLSKGLSATNKIEIISSKKEILSHDLPFIYTVRLNEMLLIYIITIFISFILHMYYKKSKNSQKQIFKLFLEILWIESVAFSFILGTWQEKILTTGENGYIYICSSLIVSAFVYGLVIFCSLSKENESYVFNQEEREDLFESRKNLLLIMEFYLKHSKGFSIIGDWGIGKTKLVENFFEKSKKENGERYGEGYEVVYIDISTFSDNKKIIYEIEDKFNLIFKKYKILKLEFELMESLFDETRTWVKNLKKLLFEGEYFNDSKQGLNEKIKELKNTGKKEIVICLDNLERIIDRERIINLLAIIDDITTDNIRKIYIYDKEHMKLIFGEINFEKYIEKYSDNFIEVKEVEIKEVVKDSKKLNVIKFDLISNLDKLLRDEESKESKELKKEIEKKKVEIEKLLTNPRKIENIQKFISNKKLEFNEETKMEYKILIELFGEFDLKNFLQEKMFFPKMTYKYRVKAEEFEALKQGKLKLENQKTRQEVKLEEGKALVGNAEEILKYIDYCKKNQIIDKIQLFFNRIQEYEIKSFSTLESFLELYLYDNIDIGLENKIKIILRKDFFSGTNTYEYEEREKIVKIILILYSFSEIRNFIRYLYNKESYNEVEILFKSKLNEFEENLKKLKDLKTYDLKKFITLLNIKSKLMNRKQKKEIFNYIDEKLFMKQMKILVELRYFQEVGLDNKEVKKINNLLETLSLNKIEYKEICTVKEKEIQLYFAPLEIDETINNENLKDYKIILKDVIKEYKVFGELYFQIFLLENRLKNN